jgi:adenosylcobinamide kinase/adenosylcobinamide-phosphate guanylyltransferase
MCQRIEQHKKERPAVWRTIEATTHIGSQIEQKIGGAQVVVVDCITLLISNILCQPRINPVSKYVVKVRGQHSDQAPEQIEESVLEKQVTAEINELATCMKKASASFIIVSNEVGLGLVPDNRLGRLYRDLLGKANQIVAQSVDEVYLMVAGLPMKVKPVS